MFRISNNTQYILYNGAYTLVKEDDVNYTFDGDVIRDILNTSCIYYGSSLVGREIASKNILNNTYKLPLIISERNNIIFFPLKAGRNYYWLNFNNIGSVQKIDKGVLVIFKNGYVKNIDVSFTVINNMLLRCSKLWVVYLSRK